jgi:ABC-type sugar transport system permease subunit
VNDKFIRKTFLKSNQYQGLLFVLPAIAMFAVFKFYPIISVVWLSFFDGNSGNSSFVGLQNYRNLFAYFGFRQSLKASITYMVMTTLPVVMFSLILAIFMQSRYAKAWMRVLIFLPVAVPQVVVATIWRFLLHPYGIVNTMIEKMIGTVGIQWLTDPVMAMRALSIVGAWRLIPYFMIIFFAGLRDLPVEYFEAAEVDGASGLRAFFHITLPLLRPQVLLVFVLCMVATSRAFVNAYLLTGGGPAGSTRILPLFIYETAFKQFQMGLASAGSVILFLILSVFTLIQFRLLPDFRLHD